MQGLVLAERDLVEITDPTRRLRVGSFSTANAHLLPTVVRRLSAVEADLRVIVREHRSGTLMRWITTGAVDIAIVSDYPSGVPPSDALLLLEHLLDDPLHVALPVDHPLATSRSLRLHHLASDSWIEADASETAVLRTAAQQAGFEPTIPHRVRDWNTKLAFVAARLGVAVVPGLAAVTPRAGVVFRSLSHDLPNRKVFLATTSASHDLPSVTIFRAIARSVIREFTPNSG